MPNVLKINVDNPDDLLNAGAYDAGAVVRVQSGSAEAGPFADISGTGSTPTVPIVAGTTIYSAFDPNGTGGSWYRTRYENAGASRVSDWSPAFQVASGTYATLDALREYLNLPDHSQDNLLTDLLADASGYLDAKCSRDFYRHPGVSGTEVRTFDGNGRARLSVRLGLVSLTTVELAPQTGAAYATLASTDWILGPSDKPDDAPYTELLLTGVGGYPSFYPGFATVRLTGVFGWAAVPPMIRKATLDLAREWYRQGPGGGGPVGINQFGTPIFGGGLPLSVRQAIEHYGPALVA